MTASARTHLSFPVTNSAPSREIDRNALEVGR